MMSIKISSVLSGNTANIMTTVKIFLLSEFVNYLAELLKQYNEKLNKKRFKRLTTVTNEEVDSLYFSWVGF